MWEGICRKPRHTRCGERQQPARGDNRTIVRSKASTIHATGYIMAWTGLRDLHRRHS